MFLVLPGGPVVQNPPTSAGDARDMGSIPGLGRSPGVREWHPTPVLLPGKFHKQRSLAGCSPWGHKESDTTERLSTNSSAVSGRSSVWFPFLVLPVTTKCSFFLLDLCVVQSMPPRCHSLTCILHYDVPSWVSPQIPICSAHRMESCLRAMTSFVFSVLEVSDAQNVWLQLNKIVL